MPNPNLSDLRRDIESQRATFEQRLSRLVAVPTVSADPAHLPDIRRGAELAVELLQNAGLQAESVQTAGNPVVVGRLVQNPGFPAITLYNHLDVQPADATAWETPPFDLSIHDGRYIGRGATDDKGPALTMLMAVEYALAHRLPLNFNIIWELEEELGSPHFEAFMQAHTSRLACDVAVVSDTMWISNKHPAISYGLRGLITFELSLRTAEEEAHSGTVGGVARNPISELAQAISECYDATTGRVLIPGFYDNVRSASAAELEEFVRSGFDVDQFAKVHKLLKLRTRETKAVLSRIMAEPTFEVHGLVGGYTGPGIKTVVPPNATAKLSTRLVPNQDPEAIFRLIKTFTTDRHPDIQVKLEAGAGPYLGDVDGPYMQAARAAMRASFGVEPALVREGGSIGAVLSLQRHLKVPVIMLGLSLPEHGYHAPGENFDWHQAAGGTAMFVDYFQAVTDMQPRNHKLS